MESVIQPSLKYSEPIIVPRDLFYTPKVLLALRIDQT